MKSGGGTTYTYVLPRAHERALGPLLRKHWQALNRRGFLEEEPPCYSASDWGDGLVAISETLPFRGPRAAEAALSDPDVQAARRELMSACRRRIYSSTSLPAPAIKSCPLEGLQRLVTGPSAPGPRRPRKTRRSK